MGIVLTFIVAFFIALLIYLLTVRLVVFVDTNANQYYIRIGQICKASVIPDAKDLIKLKVKVFF